MLKQIVPRPVDQLSIGNYVSKLDRPWEGTPFLFQGFTIENEEELAQLRQLCQVVYVEVAAAEEKQARLLVRRKDTALATSSMMDRLSETSRLLAAGIMPEIAKDTTSLRTELSNVKGTYIDAKKTVASVFQKLQRGRDLDVVQLEHVVDWMVDSVFRNRDAMSWLARMKNKDDYLYNHSIAASVWALALGRHMGLERETLTSIGMGAMLLDIGKTKLPIELLNAPKKLTDEEWKLIQTHVEMGVQMAKDTKGIDECILTMIASHHERFDGTGYPQGLKGEEIQLVGRIAGIVDSYDAMTSDRRYAKAVSTFNAMRELTRLSGTWFQPELVEMFVQAVGVFPTGTLVELNNGEVGVIISQNRFRRLRPEVMLILDAKKVLRKEFSIIDLHACEENNTPGHPGLWIERALEPDAYGIDPTEYFL